MKQLITLVFIPSLAFSQTFTQQELNKYKTQAQRVTMIRDNWGIAHVYGKTDADAVFGLLYAQCEENFKKVEENNLEMLGRLSEVNGTEKLYDDLQMRLIYDGKAAMEDYKKSPPWFKKLLDAAADGVNYFLYKHPEVKPAVLNRFEPWFALMRTNGSISATQTGGLTLGDIRSLYKTEGVSVTSHEKQFSHRQTETGSNGFAVASSKTKSRNAIIYINPHVTFYYRAEMHMVSDEGLNAYGGVTWGTFFIFQGFNEHCGWMHCTSYNDVADLYKEQIKKSNDSLFYLYNGKWLPVKTKQISIRYKDGEGTRQQTFMTYATGHGPVMGSRNGNWLSLKENNRSLNGLIQSWLRTKAKGFEEFKRVMNLRSNSSDNTVFADDKGNIAFWYGNFVPKRDEKFDWSQPVDGTTSATEWKGIHSLDELIHVYNPSTGWIQNCNSTPFTVSGSTSPKKENYPAYMAPVAENYRAINAQRLLSETKDLTIDKMIGEIGYSHYLAAFEVLLPPLFIAYDELPARDSLKEFLREPISLLKSWDRNSSTRSVATTIAIEWGSMGIASASANEKLHLLAEVIKDLGRKFGSWKTPWGDVNRYQRVGEGEAFDDSKESLASGLASSAFGSIPSYLSRQYAGTNKRYGYSGNSFVACVEFGKKLRAKAIITGGESFDPSSKHFTDQAQMFLDGDFKDVLFYKDDVLTHVERKYHPGE
jgi:acyl-homoserine lactone acylase PvdQ